MYAILSELAHGLGAVNFRHVFRTAKGRYWLFKDDGKVYYMLNAFTAAVLAHDFAQPLWDAIGIRYNPFEEVAPASASYQARVVMLLDDGSVYEADIDENPDPPTLSTPVVRTTTDVFSGPPIKLVQLFEESGSDTTDSNNGNRVGFIMAGGALQVRQNLASQFTSGEISNQMWNGPGPGWSVLLGGTRRPIAQPWASLPGNMIGAGRTPYEVDDTGLGYSEDVPDTWYGSFLASQLYDEEIVGISYCEDATGGPDDIIGVSYKNTGLWVLNWTTFTWSQAIASPSEPYDKSHVNDTQEKVAFWKVGGAFFAYSTDAGVTFTEAAIASGYDRIIAMGYDDAAGLWRMAAFINSSGDLDLLETATPGTPASWSVTLASPTTGMSLPATWDCGAFNAAATKFGFIDKTTSAENFRYTTNLSTWNATALVVFGEEDNSHDMLYHEGAPGWYWNTEQNRLANVTDAGSLSHTGISACVGMNVIGGSTDMRLAFADGTGERRTSGLGVVAEPFDIQYGTFPISAVCGKETTTPGIVRTLLTVPNAPNTDAMVVVFNDSMEATISFVEFPFYQGSTFVALGATAEARIVREPGAADLWAAFSVADEIYVTDPDLINAAAATTIFPTRVREIVGNDAVYVAMDEDGVAYLSADLDTFEGVASIGGTPNALED